jgi:hypothetical protein
MLIQCWTFFEKEVIAQGVNMLARKSMHLLICYNGL